MDGKSYRDQGSGQGGVTQQKRGEQQAGACWSDARATGGHPRQSPRLFQEPGTSWVKARGWGAESANPVSR